jgi:hypothetical protein
MTYGWGLPDRSESGRQKFTYKLINLGAQFQPGI